LAEKKIIFSFLLIVAVLGIIFIPGYLKIKSLARQNRELEVKIEEIKATNKDLQEQQQRLDSDPLYLEEVARKKLGIVREGEVIYKVLPPGSQ